MAITCSHQVFTPQLFTSLPHQRYSTAPACLLLMGSAAGKKGRGHLELLLGIWMDTHHCMYKVHYILE